MYMIMYELYVCDYVQGVSNKSGTFIIQLASISTIRSIIAHLNW